MTAVLKDCRKVNEKNGASFVTATIVTGGVTACTETAPPLEGRIASQGIGRLSFHFHFFFSMCFRFRCGAGVGRSRLNRVVLQRLLSQWRQTRLFVTATIVTLV
jgi:hypothetical protein